LGSRVDNAGLPTLLRDSFKAADGVLAPGAAIYVFHPAGPEAKTFWEAIEATRWRIRQGLVWVKDSMVLGRSDFHYRHEPVVYAYKPGGGRFGRGGSGWHGGNAETSVLEVPRPAASREHPTMKPPELLEILVRNSSGRREIVLDPFAGSGSILVACERLGRAARLVEIDPRYCDVIVDRFEALTGLAAVRSE